MPERVKWIDTAKGMGVFLVILGHLWYISPHPFVNSLIYGFHMPMFFILSGYVFRMRNEHIHDRYKFVAHKVKRLVLPAYLFICLTLPIYAFQCIHKEATFNIKSCLYVNGKVAFNTPCWFFLSLFEILLIAVLCRYDLMNDLQLAFFSAVFLLLGYLIYQFKINLLFGMEKAIIGLVFFGIGMILSDMEREKSLNWNHPILNILYLAVFLVMVWMNEMVTLYSMKLNEYGFFILSGLFGSLFFFSISKYFTDHLNIMERMQWIAYDSVFIIGTHYAFVYVLKKIAGFIGIAETAVFDAYAIAMTVCILFYFLLYKFYLCHKNLIPKRKSSQ